jgi:glycosyltransferase involved in cell wall biosynthesis
VNILWSSNAPWSMSGYGVQAQYIVPRLQRLGHQVTMFAWDGLHWGRLTLGGVDILPCGYEPFGRDFIGEHVREAGADLVVSLQDIWVLPGEYAVQIHEAGAAWLPWFPVDHEPAAEEVIKIARTADYPAVYSQHGRATMAAAGCEVEYLPFGIETDLFRPQDRALARATWGLPPDRYVVGMVAANVGYPSRKAFPENFEAFARFAARHPELDPVLMVQSDPARLKRNLDLHALAGRLGIADRTVFPDRYQYLLGYNQQSIAMLYSAVDVLLASTQGEGFGLPVAEAQACGCPVVTTRWSAMPELTVNGVCTAPAQRFWMWLNTWYAVPSIERIDAALETIAGWSDEYRAESGARGRAFICHQFDWDVVMARHWAPLLARIEAERA